MFFISKIYTTAPDKFSTPLQEKIYQSLQKLQIPFWRVNTDEAVTMEDCVQIDAALNMKMVKMELSIIVQSKHARNFPSPYRIASPHRR